MLDLVLENICIPAGFSYNMTNYDLVLGFMIYSGV